MSPRRKVGDADRDFFSVHARTPKQPRRWGLPVTASLAFVLAAAAIAGSIFMLVGH